MEKFRLILGEQTPYLPGSNWTQYEVEFLEDKMLCTLKKDPSQVYPILYTAFKGAEFGIGNGNLWLQCDMEQGSFVFCSDRKCWKSEAGSAV